MSDKWYGLLDVYTWEMLPQVIDSYEDAILYQRAMLPRSVMVVEMKRTEYGE